MVRTYNGLDLEKVLTYYGVIGLTDETKINTICPFHGDTNPSFSCNFANGTFYCFGCGLSGNALDFVKLAQPELNELEAMVMLERIIRSKKIRKVNFKEKKQKKINTRVSLAEADDYYYGLNSVDWNNIKDEKERAVLEYMEGRGFTKSALNVSDCRVSVNMQYPIIFPILDNGRFYGYVCRTMDKNVESYRKYMYNEGFKKRYTLCGEYKEGCILTVCEGYLDYLSIKTRGHVKNVVALLGWHASDEQIKKIAGKGIKTVICALDNPAIDKSGEKGLNLLKKHFNVVPFPYPDGVKDAGDMTERQIMESMRKAKNEIKRNGYC